MHKKRTGGSTFEVYLHTYHATKIQTFCAIFLRRGEKDVEKLKKPEKLKKATGAFAPAAF